MKFRGGEFSTGTMGNFQPELTRAIIHQMDRCAPRLQRKADPQK